MTQPKEGNAEPFHVPESGTVLPEANDEGPGVLSETDRMGAELMAQSDEIARLREALEEIKNHENRYLGTANNGKRYAKIAAEALKGGE